MAVSRRVVSSRFPYLPITLRVRQHVITLDALIDTGFDGHLVVPADTLVGEPADAYLPYRLADGSSVVCDALSGTVELGGLVQFPAIVAALGGECLIGRGITDQLRLILDHGTQVIAEP
jgi:predicted aspartyl protease